jgi:hypothetical protein
MTVAELIAILQKMPSDLEVIVSSQGETVQVPTMCQVEATCEEDDDGNGYTDNGERD